MSMCEACGAKMPAGSSFCGACGVPVGGARPEPAAVYAYTPHPHIENRKKRAPKKTSEEPKSLLGRFNAFLAVRITDGVGTMWCAYVFAAIALVSLPEAIRGGKATLVAWIAQTFLQLVLLSIIIVGQKVAGAASENRAIDTYKDAEALLSEVSEIQKHLLSQDACLQQLIQSLTEKERGLPGA